MCVKKCGVYLNKLRLRFLLLLPFGLWFNDGVYNGCLGVECEEHEKKMDEEEGLVFLLSKSFRFFLFYSIIFL